MRVGPLISGRAERLVVDSDVEGLGRVLEKLADAHAVTESASQYQNNNQTFISQ